MESNSSISLGVISSSDNGVSLELALAPLSGSISSKCSMRTLCKLECDRCLSSRGDLIPRGDLRLYFSAKSPASENSAIIFSNLILFISSLSGCTALAPGDVYSSLKFLTGKNSA